LGSVAYLGVVYFGEQAGKSERVDQDKETDKKSGHVTDHVPQRNEQIQFILMQQSHTRTVEDRSTQSHEPEVSPLWQLSTRKPFWKRKFDQLKAHVASYDIE